MSTAPNDNSNVPLRFRKNIHPQSPTSEVTSTPSSTTAPNGQSFSPAERVTSTSSSTSTMAVDGAQTLCKACIRCQDLHEKCDRSSVDAECELCREASVQCVTRVQKKYTRKARKQ